MEWWYVRVYPSRIDLMDETTRVVLPWFRERAAEVSATRWFFMRYLDMTGQHLRLRMRCTTEAADRLHTRLPELRELLQGVRRSGDVRRLTPVSSLFDGAGAQKVRVSQYAPELGKYGGLAGVELIEELFTRSSEWYLEHSVAELDPLSARAALAVRYLHDVVETALPGGQEAFWSAHRAQWGWQLRAVAPTQEAFRQVVRQVTATVESGLPATQPFSAALGAHIAEVVKVLNRAEAMRNPVPRERLLLELLHMDINRWGYLPADECTLGLIAAVAQTRPGPSAGVPTVSAHG
jgi:thiopeptide-type bacteriocin biosynthesis protein